jgi:hypothetical protein
MHQLLDACARAPVLRQRYLGLVRLSASRITELVRQGQEAGVFRSDLDPVRVATLLMATVIGLETMADLGVDLEVAAVGAQILALLQA